MYIQLGSAPLLGDATAAGRRKRGRRNIADAMSAASPLRRWSTPERSPLVSGFAEPRGFFCPPPSKVVDI